MEKKVVSFALELEEVEVSLTKKDGSVRECIVRELGGYQRDKYLESQRHRVGKGQEVRDYKDVQADLIVLCLFDKATQQPIPIGEVREFPSKTQTGLYDVCNEICGFDKDAKAKLEEEAKNS